MSNTNAGQGDRIDLGGKIPQFDTFASFVYKELVQNNLIWVRVADPKAGILDDIQYATKTEIHACQVKWSNAIKEDPFSYKDLINLLHAIVASWQNLVAEYAGTAKRLKVHLLSNRPTSRKDHVKDGDVSIGSFTDFLREVWGNLKGNRAIPSNWMNIYQSFISHTACREIYSLISFKALKLTLAMQVKK